MAKPILITGATGRVGTIGRTVTELPFKQRNALREMVRNEDERAQPLRDLIAVVAMLQLLSAFQERIAEEESQCILYANFGNPVSLQPPR
jgi:hypothetical protein